MHGLAVGGDGGVAHGAVVVVVVGRRAQAGRAAAQGVVVGDVDVVDQEADVADAVAVAAHVLGDGRVGAERAGDEEADVALLEQVRLAVAPAGLGPGVGQDVEAERRHQEPGEGAGVADPPLEVVDAEQARRRDGGGIAGLGVGDRHCSPFDEATCMTSQRRREPFVKRFAKCCTQRPWNAQIC